MQNQTNSPGGRIRIGSGIFFVSIDTASDTAPMLMVVTSMSDRRPRMYAAPAIALIRMGPWERQ